MYRLSENQRVMCCIDRKRTGPYEAFLGLPARRIVACKPNFLAVFSVQSVLPQELLVGSFGEWLQAPLR